MRFRRRPGVDPSRAITAALAAVAAGAVILVALILARVIGGEASAE